MRSFQHKVSNRRSIFLKLAGAIEGQLRQAYARRFEQGAETQSTIAKKLGVDKSVVSRRLSGRTNMTVETLADMVWALGYCVDIDIFDPTERNSNRHHIVPRIENEFSLKSTQVTPLRVSLSAGMILPASPDSWQIRAESTSNANVSVGVSEFKPLPPYYEMAEA